MNRNRGNTVVLTLIIITAIAAFVAASLSTTLGTARLAQRSRAYNTAIGVGLGCFDLAYSDWRSICRPTWGGPVSAVGLATISTLVASSSGAIAGSTGAIISNFSVQPTDPQLNPTTTPTMASGMNAGYSAYYYLASVTVSVPVLSGKVTVNLRRIFAEENISPWAYAIFYNDDLEINPGAPMTVNGSVHTNGSLYTAQGIAGTTQSYLTLAGDTTFSNQWGVNGQMAFDPLDSTHDGDTIASPYYPSGDPPTKEAPQTPFGFDITQIISANPGNPNADDGWRELIDIPNPNDTDPFGNLTSNAGSANGRYYDQAYVKVLIDSSNNVTILDQNGNTVTSNSTGADLTLYNMMTSAITTNQPIYDSRQEATVTLTNINVSKITTSGVVYIANTSTTGNVGIRLVQGQVLPAGGLTVASQNPVYIQGDYNTGSGTPPSDTGTPTSPTVSGYTRQPAVVAADAVDILSNNWVDPSTSSSPPSAPPTATNTTVNAALLAGIVPSGSVGAPPSNYSGGAENFPRFLENWSAATFTYYGSMVELYKSEQATNPWGEANVYVPPTRQWYFDTNLLTTSPPGGLTITKYEKQRWYLQ